jgi:hypothetical protein
LIINTTSDNGLDKTGEFYLFGIILRQGGNPAGRAARIKKTAPKNIFLATAPRLFLPVAVCHINGHPDRWKKSGMDKIRRGIGRFSSGIGRFSSGIGRFRVSFLGSLCGFIGILRKNKFGVRLPASGIRLLNGDFQKIDAIPVIGQILRIRVRPPSPKSSPPRRGLAHSRFRFFGKPSGKSSDVKFQGDGGRFTFSLGRRPG